ncbi:MAG: hypothetical protein P1U39_04725 [Legionellaceae bacterium]|nr:hypothetical protein [Legionellaceae bacterium]
MTNFIRRSQSSRYKCQYSVYLLEKKQKTYEPPAIIRLRDSEPEGGSLNVPEASTGLLES